MRRVVIATAEEREWDWRTVRTRAREARQKLKSEKHPDGGDEIRDYYREVSERFRNRGYTWEDLADGFDAIQARASAKSRENANESDHPR